MKKIEKINIYDYPENYNSNGHYDKKGQFVVDKPPLINLLMDKINELIEVVNELNEAKSRP